MMGQKLYVGNLGFGVSNADLEELFAPHGTVGGANVITDRSTGQSKGFGFVEMSSSQEAQAAVAALDGKDVGGRTIKVDEAKPRPSGGGDGAGRGETPGTSVLAIVQRRTKGDQSMFTLTDAAGTRLTHMIKQRGLPGGVAIRFVYEGEGFRIRPDSERPGDKTFEHGGRTVLLLDKPISELLADETLDANGPTMTFRRGVSKIVAPAGASPNTSRRESTPTTSPKTDPHDVQEGPRRLAARRNQPRSIFGSRPARTCPMEITPCPTRT
jgi:hypothetical protein